MYKVALWRVLRLYRVDSKLLKAVQSLYIDRMACDRIGNEVSEWFSVNVEVRQGCVMSPWFFNLVV